MSGDVGAKRRGWSRWFRRGPWEGAATAVIGLGIVMLFMLLYYRLPGLLADIALLLYALLTFAIFKLIGVVLSLAGIAGFVLSIGSLELFDGEWWL